jgi:hypothetical protein
MVPTGSACFVRGARPTLVHLARRNSECVPLPVATWVLTRVTMAIGRSSLPHCLASRRRRDCSELTAPIQAWHARSPGLLIHARVHVLLPVGPCFVLTRLPCSCAPSMVATA